jgi:hypothetical protein
MLHNSKYQISLSAECRWAKIDQISIDKLCRYGSSKKIQHVANVTKKYISTPVPTDVAVI